MTTYQGVHGTYTIIEPCRASGGEGEIFNIRGRKHLVLKRLAPRHRTLSRQKKLEAMIRTGVPQALLDQLTWPVDIVREGGQFIGYVMPALHNAEDLNVIYSDKYKLKLEDRITIAMNLCAPVDGLHQLGQYVGDGNPENICVDPKNLTITLVDTDSYTVTDRSSGRIYPCVVGLGAYLAPEVQMLMKQNHGLTNVPADTFNEATDRFWLAVHIFALLMNGAHPFAVRQGNRQSMPHMAAGQSSVNLPQPNENICRGFFPHTMQQPGFDIPVYCPRFDYLPVSVQNLFIRAFVEGHSNPAARPSAREWFVELGRMKRSLTSGTHCRNHQHQYPASAGFCPWCELGTRTVPKQVPHAKPAGKGTQCGIGAGGTRRRRRKPGCLGVLAVLLAVLMISAVSCTLSMMELGHSEKASQRQESQSKGPVAYESGMQADGSWSHPHDSRILQADDKAYLDLNGSISDGMAEVEFGLEPGFDGIYYLQTMDAAQHLYVRLYDDAGNCAVSYISEEDGDGIAVEMKAGRTYSLKVARRFADSGSFHIRWWMQKQTADITNYGAVSDSIHYPQQENIYLFRCSASREYRFCFTEATEDMGLKVYIYDANWNLINTAVGVAEGFGPYAGLQVGQNYYIKVSAYHCGDYTMTVQQTG